MGLSTSILWERALEVDSTVEVKASIRVDVDVQRLVISRSVDQSDSASLYEVIRDNNVLLVRCDLDVMRANGRLILIRVVETLDIAEIGDIEGCDVVGGCEGKVDEFTILSDVGAGRPISTSYWKADGEGGTY